MMHALIEPFYFWKTSGTVPDLHYRWSSGWFRRKVPERVSREELERQDGISEAGVGRRVTKEILRVLVRRGG